MELEHTSQRELVTRKVAGSPWEEASQVSSTIHNVHRKGSKPTAREELCNLQHFLFPIRPQAGLVKFFLRKQFSINSLSQVTK